MYPRMRAAAGGSVVRPKTDEAYEELLKRGYTDLDAPQPPAVKKTAEPKKKAGLYARKSTPRKATPKDDD